MSDYPSRDNMTNCNESLVFGLFNYVKKYPHYLLSTGLKYKKTNEWLTPNDISSEPDEAVNQCIQDRYIPGYINLQKYNKKDFSIFYILKKY